MRELIFVLITGIIFNTGCASSQEKVEKSPKDIFETIQIQSADGLLLSADLYLTENKDATFILLFHQAGYSRGAYRKIAPELNKLGFNCMAIDQRSGKEVKGVINSAKSYADSKGMGTTYPDAYPDLQAAMEYVLNTYNPSKLIIWGSSYSAALAFVLGNDYTDKIDGILAFAPGEYFNFNGRSISEYASNIHCPVFITSAKSEFEKWQGIYESIPHTEKFYYLPEDEGYHGSKALWSENKGSELYWGAVKTFLKKF